MASTTNLIIPKMVSENDAQKVATINSGTDDFDGAVAGMLTLGVGGSANITLTRTQALNRVFKFTGALTGNITIYFPVIANLALSPPTTTVGSVRDFRVWNATTGAFTLTLKTSAVGSAGVAITQTKKAVYFHDGTDVYAATAEI